MTDEIIKKIIKAIKRELRDAQQCRDSASRTDIVGWYNGKIDAYRIVLGIIDKAIKM